MVMLFRTAIPVNTSPLRQARKRHLIGALIGGANDRTSRFRVYQRPTHNLARAHARPSSTTLRGYENGDNDNSAAAGTFFRRDQKARQNGMGKNGLSRAW